LLQAYAHSLISEQYRAIRQAYADTFAESMPVIAANACAGFLLALGIYQYRPMTMDEKRQQAAD